MAKPPSRITTRSDPDPTVSSSALSEDNRRRDKNWIIGESENLRDRSGCAVIGASEFPFLPPKVLPSNYFLVDHEAIRCTLSSLSLCVDYQCQANSNVLPGSGG
ncbi:hypothetical protein F383_14461 [Gossypium arboreum]|uniref:Uncharacterized protein n=1 Tax=Gossypium arboreum TaxID=29729 RepID=A0A0B0PZK2_GOSAR|nr:hypothetical protein F383_14461 [Gossypium arboreum]